MSGLGWFHVVLSVLALASGLLVALSKKGTLFHARMGWVYVVSMVGVNVTALCIYRLLGHLGPFHVAAVLSLITIVVGLVAAVRKAPRPRWIEMHAFWMSGSYVGLCAAAVAEVATRTGWLPFWWSVAVASAIVIGAGFMIIGARVPAAIAVIRNSPARVTGSRTRRSASPASRHCL